MKNSSVYVRIENKDKYTRNRYCEKNNIYLPNSEQSTYSTTDMCSTHAVLVCKFPDVVCLC